jgi:LysR family transcriptional regulator, hca operon transcriptional activator
VELRHLRYFVAVAEELSFTRAASRLHTAQPSLSQQIRQLEEQVGVQLLERSRHHVALTNAGQVMLQQARDILGRVEHAGILARQAADGRAGNLSVGTFPSADVRVLPMLRPLLAAQMPNLQLTVHSKYAMDPLEGLRSGALDVAFMRGPLDVEGLETRELLREQLVVILQSSHPLARRKQVAMRSLDGLPCVMPQRSLSPMLHDAVASLYTQAGISPLAASSADNVLGLLQQVQQGMGFAILPDSICALLPQGVICKPLDIAPAQAISILAVWKRGNSSRLVHEFVELARRCIETVKTLHV